MIAWVRFAGVQLAMGSNSAVCCFCVDLGEGLDINWLRASRDLKFYAE